jgi:hypothetical protein
MRSAAYIQICTYRLVTFRNYDLFFDPKRWQTNRCQVHIGFYDNLSCLISLVLIYYELEPTVTIWPDYIRCVLWLALHVVPFCEGIIRSWHRQRCFPKVPWRYPRLLMSDCVQSLIRAITSRMVATKSSFVVWGIMGPALAPNHLALTSWAKHNLSPARGLIKTVHVVSREWRQHHHDASSFGPVWDTRCLYYIRLGPFQSAGSSNALTTKMAFRSTSCKACSINVTWWRKATKHVVSYHSWDDATRQFLRESGFLAWHILFEQAVKTKVEVWRHPNQACEVSVEDWRQQTKSIILYSGNLPIPHSSLGSFRSAPPYCNSPQSMWKVKTTSWLWHCSVGCRPIRMLYSWFAPFLNGV